MLIMMIYKRKGMVTVMKILYAASEAQPFAASGGLADVAGSLPKALVEAGHECAVVMPYYINSIKPEVCEKFEYVTNFYVPVGWRSQYCGIFTTKLNGVTYYFIDNEYYFKRDYGLYGYYDDAERYAFFSRAILEMIEHLELKFDIINSNDWQTALVPVYYNIYYKYHHNMWGMHNVFTIHNIGYQGQYGLELAEEIFSIPRHLCSIIEYDGDVNLMKGAIRSRPFRPHTQRKSSTRGSRTDLTAALIQSSTRPVASLTESTRICTTAKPIRVSPRTSSPGKWRARKSAAKNFLKKLTSRSATFPLWV